MTLIAKAGEKVTTGDGEPVCSVKNDIHTHSLMRASDFHEFAEGEMPWVNGQTYDRRCIRATVDGYSWQICIDGEWRP